MELFVELNRALCRLLVTHGCAQIESQGDFVDGKLSATKVRLGDVSIGDQVEKTTVLANTLVFVEDEKKCREPAQQ